MWTYILFALIILILGGSVYLRFETPKPCPCKNNGAST